jgi:hypothetical protein
VRRVQAAPATVRAGVPFSPYFSPLEPHKFAAVHKVFGASNVSKMLLVCNPTKSKAFNSTSFEQVSLSSSLV